MNKLLGSAVALLALAAAPARAGEQSGLALGLRAAYALPFGGAADGTDLRDLTTGAVPAQLDLAWRFDERWSAGAYFAWGPTFVASAARAQLRAQGARDVSGHFEQRLGVQAVYTSRPISGFSPWVGLSAGVEWTRYADAKLADGRELEVGVRGLEAGLQLGADVPVGRSFTVGPFAAFTLGQYRTRLDWTEDAGDASSSIDDRAVHGWVQLGVKGTFAL